LPVAAVRVNQRSVLVDPRSAGEGLVLVVHRDRLGRMNTELVQAALWARGFVRGGRGGAGRGTGRSRPSDAPSATFRPKLVGAICEDERRE
jgi:hypothetical protein